MINNLLKANEYIEMNIDKANHQYRPLFHATPPIGWINDVNGFGQNDVYHLFAQYYPYDTNWGTVHWGHWESKDLLNWKWKNVAIAPETDYDFLGIYSGTALFEDQNITALYTGVYTDSYAKETLDITDNTIDVDEIRYRDNVFQVQCIAQSTDGSTFNKIKGNPVIDQKLLPDYIDPSSFRDPKLFEKDGQYYTIVAAMGKNDTGGYILTFSSADLVNWNYEGNLQSNLGSMFECPDYFMINSQEVLINCVMDITDEFEGIPLPDTDFPVLYYIGHAEQNVTEFKPDQIGALDYGLDLYAPQSFESKDGRRILMGWLQCFDKQTPLTYEPDHHWNGAMSLPRELTIEDNKLIQKPIKEFYNCVNAQPVFSGTINQGESLKYSGAQLMYLNVEISDLNEMLEIRLQENNAGTEYFAVKVEKNESSIDVTVDRTLNKPAILNAEGTGLGRSKETCSIVDKQDKLKLEIIIDNCIVEVFINDGTHVMTSYAFSRSKDYYYSIISNSANESIKVDYSTVIIN